MCDLEIRLVSAVRYSVLQAVVGNLLLRCVH